MKLSIIIPVYNCARYLAQCVDSILSQRADMEYEILLCDDGSTDQSGAVCDEYAAKYDHVFAFHLENGGPGAARNFGLERARGEYIQFVDSDDRLTKDCFDVMLSAGDADLINAGAVILDEHDAQKGVIAIDCGGEGDASPREATYTPSELLGNMNIKTKAALLHYIWNKWYSARLIRENALRFCTDFNLGEDFLFNCAYLRLCGEVAVCSEPIYCYYRRSSDSLTRRFRENELERRRAMDGEFIGLYRFFGIYEQNRQFVDSAIGAIALASLESVALADCTLSRADKLKFIQAFTEEYAPYFASIRRSHELSFFGRVKCFLAEKKLRRLYYLALRIKR
ncbi:MAG: glycosyltransferase family 2 protein [Acutalibacteraceae bacterium]